MSDTPVMLIRMQPEQLTPRKGREDWSVDGHIAYSAICTHLGCVVAWNDMLGVIQCPCHDGRFNPLSGTVISGPPPAPLPSLTVKVEGDQIYLTEA
jgi:ubiquinol-cytochrome c reductase iron-sulfur subunit